MFKSSTSGKQRRKDLKEKPFVDKEQDKITIPLQPQYVDPEERAMKLTTSDVGTTKTPPRGITPGSSPEVPAPIKPDTAEHRGIFPCEADTGAAPTYPDNFEHRGITTCVTEDGQDTGEPDTTTGNTSTRKVDHHDEADDERREVEKVRCFIDNVGWKATREEKGEFHGWNFTSCTFFMEEGWRSRGKRRNPPYPRRPLCKVQL